VRLERPRARLERAKVHYREFGKTWNAFVEQDEPYSPFVRVDRDGKGTVYVDPIGLPATELSLEFGEMLYQLRATLDSLAYELAIIDSGQDPPPKAEKLEFPIRASKASFDAAARNLKPLSDLHREMVESVQPYDIDQKTEGMVITAETLQVINDLARKDRHRGLRVIASWGANKNPRFDLPDGCGVEWLKTTPDGILEHESEVASFKIRGWREGLELTANPNFTIDVTVKDAAPPLDDSDTLSSRSQKMARRRRSNDRRLRGDDPLKSTIAGRS
jgi:hypothetical protein